MKFVIRRGFYRPAKMEYSYGRRAQSVTYSLHWKDMAIVETESVNEAISISLSTVADWMQQGITAEKWVLEGRENQSGLEIVLRNGDYVLTTHPTTTQEEV